MMQPLMLDEMLVGSAEDVRKRLSHPYDAVGDCETRPIVLFGCGPLGRRTNGALVTAHRPPKAFADNDPARWGGVVDGLAVLSPEAAVRMYGQSALFVVTVYNGAAVRRQLQALGCRHVLHFASFYHALPELLLPWCALNDPAHILAARADIIDAASLWADNASSEAYVAQIAWRLGLSAPALPAPHPSSECYFPRDLFLVDENDFVVDCGAFDGDSLRLLLAQQQSFGGFLCLEPDPASFERLSLYLDTVPADIRRKVSTRECAVSSATGTLRFAASGSVESGANASGDVYVEAAALDDLLETQRVTLIKMDVEGAEAEALMGARRTLARDTPILAIAAYHRVSDLWEIPRLIKSMVPDYDLFLRRYAEDCWELVCYALPASRRRGHVASPSESKPLSL